MLYTDFCKEFNQSINKGDVNSAHRALMQELGRILVRQKQDFVDLLNESGYEAELIDSESDLVDTFADNVAQSPSLMVGASMLVATHNKEMNFDGEDEYLDDDLVKDGYRVMVNYFETSPETYSNAIDPVTAIAEGIGKSAELASTISKGRQRKKYGGQDIASQKEATKQQLLSGILQAKQQQSEASKKSLEEKAKTRRTLYIAGGAILAISVIGVVIYIIRKRK